MGHKCYISFKTEDFWYKNRIQGWALDKKVDMIDKSLNVPIESENEDYIMRRIREDYLADSTVTIFLIGLHSSENMGSYEQRFIKRELQASLYNGEGNTRNGILGVVLPQMYNNVYKGDYCCSVCNSRHKYVAIEDSTVIREFSRNYYLNNHGKCYYSPEDRYCILVKWEDFEKNPNLYIEMAYEKRYTPLADEVKVYP